MKNNVYKKIRIGIFLDGDFIPSYNGAKNRIHYLSRYLSQIGVGVVVFYAYRGRADLNLIAQEPFKTYIFSPEQYYGDLDGLTALLKKEKINIIQFCDLESTLTQGIYLSQKTGAYLISELHYPVSHLARKMGESHKKVQSIQEMESIVGAAVDQVICLTKEDSNILKKTLGIFSARISILPSGVDAREIKFRGPNFSSKKILFLGNLYFKPNLDAVRAIYYQMSIPLSKRGFTICVVGDFPPRLRKTFHSRNFRLLGPIADLDKVFSKTTIGLAPVQEGSGLRIKILNYLGAGLPIIATSAAVNGLPKGAIRNIFIENDLEKYPRIVFDILAKKDAFLPVARQERDFIENNLDWTSIAMKTAQVYLMVIAKIPRKKEHISPLKLRIGKPDWLKEFECKRPLKGVAQFPDKFLPAVIYNREITILHDKGI